VAESDKDNYELDSKVSSVRESVASALKAVTGSPGWLDSSDYHTGGMMYEWLSIIYNLQLQAEMFSELTKLLDDIDEQFPMHSGWLKNVWNIYDVFSRPDESSNLEQLISADEAFLVRAKRWSFDRRAIAIVDYLPHAPLYWLSNFGLRYDLIKDDAIAFAKEALTHFPEKSEWFMTVISGYEFQLNCSVIEEQYCQEQYKPSLLNEIYPHTYKFDDGRFVVRTGLDESVVQRLFSASQQVKAQFFRKTQNTIPVPGDDTEFLTIFVAHSLEQYSNYQSFLFNLPSDNGGIYIEQDATFYTYQRTANDSIYTLEELFRHEYVHYLEARYQIHGEFGENPFHDSPHRLWEVEGLAEYLSGATQHEGVLKRSSLLHYFSTDANSWMSVEDILTAESGFAVYPFGMMFHNYLNDEHPSQHQTMFKLIREDDIEGYNSLIQSWLETDSLVSGFQVYMTSSIANLGQSREPITEWLPSAKQSLNSLAVVQDAYNLASGRSFLCELLGESSDIAYECTAPRAVFEDEITLQENMDSVLKSLVNEYGVLEITDVCYPKEFEINQDGVVASILCEGDLASEFVENMPPFAAAEADFALFDGEQGKLSANIFDPESESTTVTWLQTAGPLVEVTSDEGAKTLAFTAPRQEEDTLLTFSVDVSDSEHTTSDEVRVMIINKAYHPPTIESFVEIMFYRFDELEYELAIDDFSGEQYSISWQVTDFGDNALLQENHVSIVGQRLVLASNILEDLSSEIAKPGGLDIEIEVTLDDGIATSNGIVRINLNNESLPDFGSSIEGIEPIFDLEFKSNETISVSLGATSTLNEILTYEWQQINLDDTETVDLDLGTLEGATQQFDISEIDAQSYEATGRIVLQFSVVIRDSQSQKTVSVRLYINQSETAVESVPVTPAVSGSPGGGGSINFSMLLFLCALGGIARRRTSR